jgi:predicted nucleic acid-binding Zn ribbon protein
MSKNDNTFSSVAEILKDQIDGLSGGRLNATIELQKNWLDIVGKSIAEHSKVLFIKNKCLHIGVENSTWLNELNLIKDKLSEKITSIKKDGSIVDLKFKIYLK